jgi:hypothetical protein
MFVYDPLVVFEPAHLAELPLPARTEIENAREQVDRALGAGDVAQIIGTSKELVETVAKVAINALGGTFGSTRLCRTS